MLKRLKTTLMALACLIPLSASAMVQQYPLQSPATSLATAYDTTENIFPNAPSDPHETLVIIGYSDGYVLAYRCRNNPMEGFDALGLTWDNGGGNPVSMTLPGSSSPEEYLPSGGWAGANTLHSESVKFGHRRQDLVMKTTAISLAALSVPVLVSEAPAAISLLRSGEILVYLRVARPIAMELSKGGWIRAFLATLVGYEIPRGGRDVRNAAVSVESFMPEARARFARAKAAYGNVEAYAMERTALQKKALSAQQLEFDSIVSFAERQTLARSFLQARPRDVASHLRCIDLSQPVEVVVLKKGAQVLQYRLLGRGTGSYFTTLGTRGGTLGTYTGGSRAAELYSPVSDIQVLKSTAADATDFWTVPGLRIEASGGGDQYLTLAPSMFELAK